MSCSMDGLEVAWLCKSVYHTTKGMANVRANKCGIGFFSATAKCCIEQRTVGIKGHLLKN